MTVETKTYQGSEQEYGVVIDHDVIVRTRDGTPLATSMYYPALEGQRAPGTFPALWTHVHVRSAHRTYCHARRRR